MEQNPLGKTFSEEHPLNFSWDKSSDDVGSSDVYEFVPETQTPSDVQSPDIKDDVPPFVTPDVAHLVNTVRHLCDRVYFLETKLESYELLEVQLADLVTVYPSLRKKVDKLYYLRNKKDSKREKR
jgi:hypothetical protein